MNKILIGLVIIAAGAAIGWYWFGGSPINLNTPQTSKEATGESVTPTGVTNNNVAPPSGEQLEKGGVKERTVVTYTDTGYAPNSVTVKKGSIVTFVNESTRGMWTTSDLHPTHQLLPGFDQKAAAGKGGTYEYTFDKVGTWTYHNHVNAADKGTVVVTE